ncbi:MAG: ribonuclease HI family protein [Candidatus Paceibacterota bacterium]
MDKITIFTDGGAKDNPGPAAIGVIIYKDGKKVKEYSEFIGEATNNEAEYKALIFALKKVKSLYGKEEIKNVKLKANTDSELMAEQLSGNYKIKDEKIQPLFLKAWNLSLNYGEFGITAIPREKNEEADKLVKQSLKQQKLL